MNVFRYKHLNMHLPGNWALPARDAFQHNDYLRMKGTAACLKDPGLSAEEAWTPCSAESLICFMTLN